jgi:acylphosphatase
MKRANIIIKGKVQMAGFRTFIKNTADSLNVTGFADNLPNGSVNIVCEGEDDKIDVFANTITEHPPSFVSTEEINVEYEEYRGEFTGFERRGADVPREESEMLTVMKSFDKKAEKMVGILTSMNGTLKSVKEDTGQMLEKQDSMLEKQDSMLEKQDSMLEKQDSMLEKQDSMLEKQDSMLEKQDITIETLKSVKEDTSQIRRNTSIIPGISEDIGVIKEDIGEIKDVLIIVTGIREETKELSEKYEILSRDVGEIKAALKLKVLKPKSF